MSARSSPKAPQFTSGGGIVLGTIIPRAEGERVNWREIYDRIFKRHPNLSYEDIARTTMAQVMHALGVSPDARGQTDEEEQHSLVS